MGAARLYKAGTPFNAADLQELDYAQSADVVYFAHLNYPPQRLVRQGHTSWAFSAVPFGPTIAAPTGVAAAASAPNKDLKLSNGDPNEAPQYYPSAKSYAVTSVNAAGQESRLSAVASASNDLTLKGNFNTVTWAAAPGAEFYNVYAQANGSNSMGYLGRAVSASFKDGEGGVAPDYADGPRIATNPFDGPGNYPSTVTFHQQRLIWGRTANKPNGIWASFSADFENMDRSRPGKADDAFSLGLVSDRVNAVNQLASMRSLLALTSDGIFSVSGENDVLTATSIRTDRQLGVGAGRMDPLVIDSTLLFRPLQGSSVRALGYTFEVDGFRSNNVAIFSPHFFDGYDIISWDYQREPYSCVWAVRSDGKLLCLTWEQEQQVWGWTLCETRGAVEQVAVITEEGMDRVYLAVRRQVGGRESVFIERMALPLLTATSLVDSCYLDCAVTQKTDEPTTTIRGLWHLEGELVTVFADGYVVEKVPVSKGQAVLQFEARTITAGLPYAGEIETLPMPMEGNHTVRQMLADAVVRVDKTRGIKVGAGGGEMYELPQREDELLDEPITLKTGDFHVNVSAAWNDGATLRVVQEMPLPATISALFLRPKATK